MNISKLGSQGMMAARMGFGVMNLGGNYGEAPTESEAINVIHRAAGLGVTLFDTAEVYGPFVNEELLGKALKGAPGRLSVSTKFGWNPDDPDGGPPRIPGLNSRPEKIRACCEGSLRRLGIETIDLYFQHRVDPAVPIEEVAGTVGDLVKQGKVRYFGLSEPGEDSLRRAHAVHPVTAIENEYSLWTRDPERWALRTCRELGIGFVAYSPLGRGFLTGTVSQATLGTHDHRLNHPRFDPQSMAANALLVAKLGSIARQKQCTTGQLALAWLLHQGVDIFPIPGTRRTARVAENVAATEIALDDSELAAIEAVMPPDKIQGARYPNYAAATLAR